AAHARTLTRPDRGGRSSGRPACRSAPVRSLWQGYFRAPGRIDPGRPEERFARGEFFAGRRQQRYLGARRQLPGGHRKLGGCSGGDTNPRSERAMLSRVADSIYWMSRYVERAENVARLIDVNLNMMLDSSGAEQQWWPLVNTTGDHADFQKRY